MLSSANPFDVNGTYLKYIKIVSHYIDLVDGDTADINGSRISEDTTCAIGDEGCVEDNADNNATFYYGRTRASQYFYEDITEPSVITPIIINVYCTSSVTCSDYDINIVADRTDESNWYLSMDHDADRGDGNVTVKVGTPLIEPVATAATDQAINNITFNSGNAANIMIITNAINNDVNVSRGTVAPPLTVPLELVQDGDSSAPPYTNEWLIYNKDFPTVPDPFYKVRFIGNSAWTGTGNTGDVVNINASRKKSKRMDW